MSHFTTIQTHLKDIEALKAACAELELTLEEKGEARGYGDNRYPGDYIIKLKGPYDIAVVREANGTYGLITDWWEGHVEREVGPKFGRLLQLYGVHKVMREASTRSYAVQRQKLDNGTIKLVIGGV